MRAFLCATSLFGLLVVATACDRHKPSRFDEVAGVDVCQLISRPEAEHILGALQQDPVAGSGEFAGQCTWQFDSPVRGGSGTLSVMMSTRASSPHGPPPARFFAVSQAEVEASLGAAPWKMEDLGDLAYLYQTRQPDHAELWMLQSQTLLILRIIGGSASQLEQFARALSRELLPPEQG